MGSRRVMVFLACSATAVASDPRLDVVLGRLPRFAVPDRIGGAAGSEPVGRHGAGSRSRHLSLKVNWNEYALSERLGTARAAMITSLSKSPATRIPRMRRFGSVLTVAM